MMTSLVAVVGTFGPSIKKLVWPPDSDLSMHVIPSGEQVLNLAVTNSGEAAGSILAAAVEVEVKKHPVKRPDIDVKYGVPSTFFEEKQGKWTFYKEVEIARPLPVVVDPSPSPTSIQLKLSLTPAEQEQSGIQSRGWLDNAVPCTVYIFILNARGTQKPLTTQTRCEMVPRIPVTGNQN